MESEERAHQAPAPSETHAPAEIADSDAGRALAFPAALVSRRMPGGSDRAIARAALSVQRLAGNRAASRLLQRPVAVQRLDPGSTIDIDDLPEAGLSLSEGSRGTKVRKLQLQLNFRGASPELEVDGIFGPKTRQAVVDFQRRVLKTAGARNGRVDGKTWEALFEYAPGAPGGSDEAAYQGAIRDHDKDLAALNSFVQSGLKSADVMTRNSCQQVVSHRMKVYALTPTADSAERAAAAGKPAGAAYFSYPAGALYEPPVTYAKHSSTAAPWDNTNVNIQDSSSVDGFQDTGVIAFMQSAIKHGKDYFLGVLRHEVQHFVDDHGDTALEGYKTEFRAYWLGSREYDSVSPTTFENHKGYRWNSRQWAIFNNLYTSDDYAYVKQAWDAEEAKPVGSRPFQQAVVAFTHPDSVNPHNSTRVADFDKAIRAVTTARCDGDKPDHPDPLVAAVRKAHDALDNDDKASVKRSTELQALIGSHTSGQLRVDLADVIK